MVMVKIGAILTFLVVGGMLVNPANWTRLLRRDSPES